MAIEREIEELSARLLQLSRGDELTGFQNRRGLIAAGTQLLQFADRQGRRSTHLFVDVGNVQELNERLGHQAGDAALQAVARALSVTFRKNDVLARIGGTQFLALTLHLAESDCATVTSRDPGPPRPHRRRRSSSAPPSRSPAAGRPARAATARRSRTGGAVRLGHAGVPGWPPGRLRVVPGRRRLTLRPYRSPTLPGPTEPPEQGSCRYTRLNGPYPDQAAWI